MAESEEDKGSTFYFSFTLIYTLIKTSSHYFPFISDLQDLKNKSAVSKNKKKPPA